MVVLVLCTPIAPPFQIGEYWGWLPSNFGICVVTLDVVTIVTYTYVHEVMNVIQSECVCVCVCAQCQYCI